MSERREAEYLNWQFNRLDRKLDVILAKLGILLNDEENEEQEFVAKSLTVTIEGKMNTVLTVGKTAQATAHEWSGLAGAGVELPLAGAISWVSADPTVATVDPASGLITAVGPSKKDATGAAIPVDITATDAANKLSNPLGDATVTDVALTAQSLTVTVAASA
jgi:hypothetical protein